MKKLYLLSVYNGMHWEDSEYTPILASDDLEKLNAWKDSHPITTKMYEEIFKTSHPSWADSPEYQIESIWMLE